MGVDDWEEEFPVAKEAWEDDDDDVKDSWDVEEEEKQQPASKPPASRKKTVHVEDVVNVESEAERRQRLERLQQESDLENAKSLFGAANVNVGEALGSPAEKAASIPNDRDPIDGLELATQKDVDHLVELIAKKVSKFEESKLYPGFVESLARTLLGNRDVPEIRKIAGVINDMAANKQRERLAAAKKKPCAATGSTKKASAHDLTDYGDVYDDYD